MHQLASGKRRIGLESLCMTIGGWFVMVTVAQAAVEVLGTIELTGEVVEGKQISAIGVLSPERWIIAADEGDKVQILRRVDDSHYEVERTLDLVNGKNEADFEGLAINGAEIYVVGSHSRKRERVKAKKKQKKNLERLARSIEPEPSRDQLLRFTVDDDGKLSSKIELKLRGLLDGDTILSLFKTLPSKENGIDIEGLAVRGQQLFIGFRGPVLRHNFVPILRFEVDHPEKHELLFVSLNGAGLRGMSEVAGGLLLLSGAVGDGRESHVLYFWDGRTCVPGKDVEEPCILKELGEVPLPEGQSGAKAEGLALLDENDVAYEIVVVYDSAQDGAPARMRVDKP